MSKITVTLGQLNAGEDWVSVSFKDVSLLISPDLFFKMDVRAPASDDVDTFRAAMTEIHREVILSVTGEVPPHHRDSEVQLEPERNNLWRFYESNNRES